MEPGSSRSSINSLVSTADRVGDSQVAGVCRAGAKGRPLRRCSAAQSEHRWSCAKRADAQGCQINAPLARNHSLPFPFPFSLPLFPLYRVACFIRSTDSSSQPGTMTGGVSPPADWTITKFRPSGETS